MAWLCIIQARRLDGSHKGTLSLDKVGWLPSVILVCLGVGGVVTDVLDVTVVGDRLVWNLQFDNAPLQGADVCAGNNVSHEAYPEWTTE